MRYRDIRGLVGDTVYKYTSSIEHDHHIYKHVLRVMSAHLIALREAGHIGDVEASKLAEALLHLWRSDPEEVLVEGYEDVFEAVEAKLHSLAGPTAGWIALGRSRNDHVSAALRLYVAESLYRITVKMAGLRGAVLEKALEYIDVPLPGYTHGQPSQVITGGCLFLAYGESLEEASEALIHAATQALKSPLGAGAGAGTLARLDEALLAGILGFESTYRSPYYAVASRVFLSHASLASAISMVELSRIAEDLVRLAEEGIIAIPEGHIATSSIMPHKSNPVTLEVLRARASASLGEAFALASIQAKLRYSYNLDLQEANPKIYTLIETLESSIEVLKDLITGVKVDGEKALEVIERYKPWSAEAAEELSMRDGIPLREAYRRIAAAIVEKGQPPHMPPKELQGKRATGCRIDRIKREIENALREAIRHREEAEKGIEKLTRAEKSIIEKLQAITKRRR